MPLVYALLSSKESAQYSAVLRAVNDIALEYRIENCRPTRIMTDFPCATITCCVFHLGKSVYRRIQAEGLQEAYNDHSNRELKMYTHMMLSLAFVPPNDVKTTFQILSDHTPEELLPVLDYFGENYVLGRPARGSRRAIPPRYPVGLWNQHESYVNGSHRTNNVSEGWHNRFAILVGKHHPDLYSLLTEIQKKQADTEVAIAEISIGRAVKAAPKKKWFAFQRRLQGIVGIYEDYEILEFLRA